MAASALGADAASADVAIFVPPARGHATEVLQGAISPAAEERLRASEKPRGDTPDVTARTTITSPPGGDEVGRRMEAHLRLLDAELCSTRSAQRRSSGEKLSFIVGSEHHARLTRALDELHAICKELQHTRQLQ